MKTIILIFLFIVFGAGYAQSETNTEDYITPSFMDNKQPLSKDTIICEFQASTTFRYGDIIYNEKDEKAHYKTNKIYFKASKDKKPFSITFTGLTTNKPQVKSSAGTSPLRISRDNDDVIMFEQKPWYDNDIIFYAIYKKEKIAIFHMISFPDSYVTMGYCY